MKNDLYFVPIFKSKFSAEPEAILNCRNLFNTKIIPYIEIINELDSKGYNKILKNIDGIKHFEQIYRKPDSKLNEAIDVTKKLIKDNVIPSIHFTKDDCKSYDLDYLNSFITLCHENNSNCAIRIFLGHSIKETISLSEKLNKDDFIIIDIEDNDYQASSLFLEDLKHIKQKCNLLIFSNERPLKLSNTMLKANAYNEGFNTSLIDSVKSNSFIEDGFGSYCSAKNDTIESTPNKNEVFGVFLIYNFKENRFFSLKTKKKDHLSRVYSKFKDDFLYDSEIIQIVNELFLNTPISKGMIDSFLLDNKKGNASKYIAFSLVHYIEEISNNI